MAKDDGKVKLKIRILQELEKFDDPMEEQQLKHIVSRLQITKQNLNYYLRVFVKDKLAERVSRGRCTNYQLTPKGRIVKENLTHSERGVKSVIWRYHALIVGFKISTWGNFKFNQHKVVRLNNWFYQPVKAKNGIEGRIHSTGTLKLYGPEIYTPDPEEARIKASMLVQEAAQWFADHFDFTIGRSYTIRKGEKELPGSEQLARIFGRVNTPDFYVNASGGQDALEEPENSYKIENILSTLERTPLKLVDLERNQEGIRMDLAALRPVLQELTRQLALHLEVESKTSDTLTKVQDGVVRFTELAEKLSSGTRVSEHPGPGELPRMGPFCASNIEKKPDYGLYSYMEPKKLHIQFTRDTPGFSYLDGQEEHVIQSKVEGGRIYLPTLVARDLIKRGFAREVVARGG